MGGGRQFAELAASKVRVFRQPEEAREDPIQCLMTGSRTILTQTPCLLLRFREFEAAVLRIDGAAAG